METRSGLHQQQENSAKRTADVEHENDLDTLQQNHAKKSKSWADSHQPDRSRLVNAQPRVPDEAIQAAYFSGHLATSIPVPYIGLSRHGVILAPL